MLYLKTWTYQHHTSLLIHRDASSSGIPCCESLEIHGPVRVEIALAVLNNYPLSLAFIGKEPAVRVKCRRDGELFSALKELQELRSPIRRRDVVELLKNPTLERLKTFVALRKLTYER